MSKYNKAIVALIVPVVLSALEVFGVTPQMTVGEAVPLLVGAVVTAALVWVIPNRK